MEVKNKVLIVDDSNVIKKVMTLYLSKKGYRTFTASSALEGVSIIKKENIDMVITSLNMPKITGLDFLLWLKKHKRNIKIIVMTAFANEETKKFIMENMGIGYFEKSSDYDHLDSMIRNLLKDDKPDGKIKEISLFDFFYLIYLAKKDKVISILERVKNRKGIVYFKKGQIVHAEYGELEGESALYEIMKIVSGEFIDQDWYEPKKNSISGSFEFLLMNIAKKIDEERQNLEYEINSIGFEKSNIKKNVLLFEVDIANNFLNSVLLERNFNINIAKNPEQFISYLQLKQFGLVICDIKAIEAKGLEFFIWLNKNSGNTRVLIAIDSITDDAKNFAKRYSTISYINKPIVEEKIDNYLEMYVKDSFDEMFFSGTVKDISLFDFIQVISLSRKSKVLSVTEPIHNRVGYLYMDKGKLTHVKFDDLIGEEAFHSIVKNKCVLFSELDWVEPEQKSINSDLSSLIIRALNILENKFNHNNQVKLQSDMGTFISSNLSKLEQLVEESESSFNSSEW